MKWLRGVGPALLAGHQEFPCYAGELVDQCHRHQLRRLALEEFHEPWRSVLAAPLPNVTQKSSSPCHEHASQGFIAGTCNNAEPDFSGGGVILWRQSEPGGEMPTRSEAFGCRHLHNEQRRADRADAGNFRKPPTAFVGPVPSHQSGFDLGDFSLQLSVFSGMKREQVASKLGQRLIGRDTLEQEFHLAYSLSSTQSKLGGIATYGIGELGAILDQPHEPRSASTPPGSPRFSQGRTASSVDSLPHRGLQHRRRRSCRA